MYVKGWLGTLSRGASSADFSHASFSYVQDQQEKCIYFCGTTHLFLIGEDVKSAEIYHKLHAVLVGKR